jgi:hypothetical protein
MNIDDLLGIDVGAELATLCAAQLQGPWQVPAELVRLANARGVSRVEVRRQWGGFEIRCDGSLARRDELEDLIEVFDSGVGRRQRQASISRIEAAGLSALLWAAGLPGARLRFDVRSGGRRAAVSTSRDGLELETGVVEQGPPVTRITWRCRRLDRRRAVSWLRTALRFVPIPVTVCGRVVERGFPGGLYRMRIQRPLPAELAITSAGETPMLWLLEHGVLSARAVVPGFPAFSAALEMSGVVPAGSSADELRTAANPHLDRVIDEAARMLVLLVERLPSAEPAIRSRLTSLLLGFAHRGIRREQIMSLPVIVVRHGSRRRMESPTAVAEWAARHGGVVAAVEPEREHGGAVAARTIVASAEERSLLSQLLGLHIEIGGARPGRSVRQLRRLLRRWNRALRGLAARPLGETMLGDDERRLLDAAASVGVRLRLCEGDAPLRTRGDVRIVGRRRPEIRAAARAVAAADGWLYPALLAIDGELADVERGIRARWRGTVIR